MQQQHPASSSSCCCAGGDDVKTKIDALNVIVGELKAQVAVIQKQLETNVDDWIEQQKGIVYQLQSLVQNLRAIN
jgi:hypothetical protein